MIHTSVGLFLTAQFILFVKQAVLAPPPFNATLSFSQVLLIGFKGQINTTGSVFQSTGFRKITAITNFYIA